MKCLNINLEEKSDIKYKISHFPDGQQDITILPNFALESIIESNSPVLIQSRFNSLMDLELIICATKALRRLSIAEIHLHIPYILGARSDRQFIEGGTSYLVDVIAPILNLQNFTSVTCLDAHSDVAAACIDRLKVVSNCEFVQSALNKITTTRDSWVLVSPDGGSLKKIYKVSDAIGFTGEIVVCSKHRDSSGLLTKTIVPLTSLEDRTYIIIDDICDGGRTFINIAEEIKRLHDGLPWNSKIYLIITHGVFSAGVLHLTKYFEKIFVTNSIKDMSDDNTVGYSSAASQLHQINIFNTAYKK